MKSILVEILADYAHRAWVGRKGTINSAGEFVLPKEYVDRRNRQINTSYKDLPENEKESDRKEAREIIDLCEKWFFRI